MIFRKHIENAITANTKAVAGAKTRPPLPRFPAEKLCAKKDRSDKPYYGGEGSHNGRQDNCENDFTDCPFHRPINDKTFRNRSLDNRPNPKLPSTAELDTAGVTNGYALLRGANRLRTNAIRQPANRQREFSWALRRAGAARAGSARHAAWPAGARCGPPRVCSGTTRDRRSRGRG